MSLGYSGVGWALIWSWLVQHYGMQKDAATAALNALQGDVVTMLLMPDPTSWDNVAQIANAAFRKASGLSPIVLDLSAIL